MKGDEQLAAAELAAVESGNAGFGDAALRTWKASCASLETGTAS
ncbi:MAG TPA: hypothetical protein VF774_22425 [Pseudoduganella sp.]